MSNPLVTMKQVLGAMQDALETLDRECDDAPRAARPAYEPVKAGHSTTCEVCGSRSILNVTGKTSDLCCVTYGKHRTDSYVPEDINIGGGDYIEFSLCMQCGRVQHFEPKTPSQIHKAMRAA